MPKQYRYGGKVYNLPDGTSDADALAFVEAQHEGEESGQRVSNMPDMDISPSLMDKVGQGIKWMFTPKMSADKLGAERQAHPDMSRAPIGAEVSKPQGFMSERDMDEATSSMTSPVNVGLAVAGDPFVAGTSKAATIASRVASGAAGVSGVLQGERQAEEGHPVAGLLNAGVGMAGAYGAGKGIAPETGENLMNRVIGTDVNALDAGINPGAALVRRGINANSAESLLEKIHEARVTDPDSPALIEAEQSLSHKINASKLRPAMGMSDWATGGAVLGAAELAGGAQTAIHHPVATAATVGTGIAAKKLLGSTPVASRMATWLGRQSLPPDLSPEVPEFVEGEYVNPPAKPKLLPSGTGNGEPVGGFSMPESPLPKQKLLDRVNGPVVQSKGAQGAEATQQAFAEQGLNITLEQAENDVMNQAAQARAALDHVAKTNPELAKALESHPDFAPLFETANGIATRRGTTINDVARGNGKANQGIAAGSAPEAGEGNGGLQSISPEARGTLAEKVNGKVGEGATPPVESPEMTTLYHGTPFDNGPNIAREGLLPTDYDNTRGPFASVDPEHAAQYAGPGGHIVRIDAPKSWTSNTGQEMRDVSPDLFNQLSEVDPETFAEFDKEFHFGGRSIPPDNISHHRTLAAESAPIWDKPDPHIYPYADAIRAEHADTQSLQDQMRANLEAHGEVADSTRNKLFYAGNKPDYDPMIGEWEGGAPTLFDFLDDLRRRQPRQR